MVSFTTSAPLAEAVAQISGRTPLGSAMGSAEWEREPAAIRLRSMFSAKVLDEQILAEMQARLVQSIALERSKLADGTDGAHMDRGRFIEEMRQQLTAAGYKRNGVKRGSLRDLKSTRRLGLIWQMNTDQAMGYAQWKTGQTAVALKMWPCLEFVRITPRREIRNWPEIWLDHGGKFYGAPGPDYPQAPGRMLALRNDPIFRRINRFGVPWKPFDWGSGMGTRNTSRATSISLGVIQEDDAPEDALDVPFNANAKASLVGIPESGRRRILDAMAGDVEIVGDEIRILPPPVIPKDFAIPAPPSALSDSQAKARKALSGLSKDDLASALQPIRSTVADMRLRAAAKAAGAELDDSATVGRALLQWFAMAAGLGSVVRAMREEPARDAVWGEMDFSPIAGFFDELLGGQS